MRTGSLLGVVAVALLGTVAGGANAATPAPDPPPLGVAPDKPVPDPTPPRAARQLPAVVRTVVTETPVVTPTATTPSVVTREAPGRPAPKNVVEKQPTRAAANPKSEPVTATPPERTHDRPLLPRPDVAVAVVDELDRGVLALAGAGLAFVALGGAVLLLATRRQLGELAR